MQQPGWVSESGSDTFLDPRLKLLRRGWASESGRGTFAAQILHVRDSESTCAGVPMINDQ